MRGWGAKRKIKRGPSQRAQNIQKWIESAVKRVPTIPKLKRAPRHQEQIVATATALFVFYLVSHIPVFVGNSSTVAEREDDASFWRDAIVASRAGTWMTVGASPTVLAGMLVQVAHVFEIEFEKTAGEQLRLALTVGIAIFECLLQAILLRHSFFNTVFVFLQFAVGTSTALGIDTALSTGYGLVNGYSLFIASPVCERLFSLLVSAKTVNGEFVSILPALITGRVAWDSFWTLLRSTSFIAFALWVSSLRVNVPLSGASGASSTAHVSLLYHGTTPIMLFHQLVGVLARISELLYSNYGGNVLIRLLGKWNSGSPVGGLMFVLCGPSWWFSWPTTLLHACVHVPFVLGSCAFIGHEWTEAAGNSAKNVMRNAQQHGFTATGHRGGGASLSLQRYVPVAAALGGSIVALLAFCADYAHLAAGGTSLLLTAETARDLSRRYSEKNH